MIPNPTTLPAERERRNADKGRHQQLHLADWEDGSGYCYCNCGQCFIWLQPDPKTGKSRGGVCICKDCPHASGSVA